MDKRICSVEGCYGPHRGHGYCNKHFQRVQKYGSTELPKRDLVLKVCVVEDCEGSVAARGWCSGHYARWKEHGDPLAGKPLRRRQVGPCLIDECSQPIRTAGYCSRHYARFLRHGNPEIDMRKSQRRCWGPECDRMTSATQGSGLCRAHQEQIRRGRLLAPLLTPYRDTPRPSECSFEGCDRRHSARGYCRAHNKQIDSGQPLSPISRRLSSSIPCSIDGCEKKRHSSGGLCSSHYSILIARFQRYGISPEIGNTIWLAQSQACAICRVPAPLDELVIDHDHDCCPSPNSNCGKCVRGMLCKSCNYGMGGLRDDPALLRAAAAYLEQATRR